MPTFARNLAPEKLSQATPGEEVVDTSNQFAVIRSFDEVVIAGLLRLNKSDGRLSREQALNLASWLIAVADPQDETGIVDWTLGAILGNE